MKLKITALIIALLMVSACSPRSKTPIHRGQPAGGGPSPTPQQGPQGGGSGTTPEIPSEGSSILTGSPTDAQMGDWDSSGDIPPFPPPMEKDFHFQCSAFLQDQVSRKARVCEDCEEKSYRLYRLYNFELTKENPSVSFKDLTYRKIAYFGLNEGLEKPTWEVEEDILLENSNVTLNVSFIESWDEDQPEGVLQTSMSVAQGFGDRTVHQFKHQEQSANDSYISIDDSIFVKNQDGESDDSIPSLLVEIRCQPLVTVVTPED